MSKNTMSLDRAKFIRAPSLNVIEVKTTRDSLFGRVKTKPLPTIQCCERIQCVA